jgi:hypothetical protein
MHAKDDVNCTRGYEWWLMREAKERNPNIITYGLAWGYGARFRHGFAVEAAIGIHASLR